jgi:hypothetical protein
MTLGFITLLCMVIVAVYKSNQPKQLGKGSKGVGQGMYYDTGLVKLYPLFFLTSDPEVCFFLSRSPLNCNSSHGYGNSQL